MTRSLAVAEVLATGTQAPQSVVLPENTGTFLRGDATFAVPASGSGDLIAANNLSDVASASTSRTNLGLGTAATTAATDYATAAQGAKADTALQNVSTAWPVGSIFISVSSTNPGTSLGFGTWSAFGAGRVLVGLDSGDTDFDTVEETGGAKTVTLTGAQSGLPQHTHVQNAHSHNIGQVRDATTGGATTNIAKTADTSSTLGTSTATDSATPTNQDAGPTNAAQAHTNLQPYIVVYMFKRTA